MVGGKRQSNLTSDVYTVRALLIRYDGLSNWTCTESRYVELATGCSAWKARKLVALARGYFKKGGL